MATTPFLIMASREPTREETIQTLIGFEDNKPTETGKQKVKRSGKSKSPAKKKPPQRGMGVAQLERLRLQERWKKLTEPGPDHSLLPQTQFHPQIPHSFSVPFGSSPVISNGGNGSSLSRLLMLQRLGNGGHGFNGVGSSVSDDRGPGPDWVQEDLFKNIGGGCDPRSGNGRNVFETPKELSSIPKLQCVPDPCDFCFKKKRTSAESSELINGGRDKFVDASSMMNGGYFLGLNLGNNGINEDQFINFNAASRRPGPRLDKEVEVMAVHRNESSVGGSIFMEYEFLPSNRNPFFCPNEAAGVDTSNNDTSIDLSLKL